MGKFYIYEDMCIYQGKIISNKAHSHHFIEVLYSKQPIALYIEDNLVEGRNIVINSDVKHHCTAQDVNVCVLNIDPDSSIGLELKGKYLQDKMYAKLDIVDIVDAEMFIRTFKNLLNTKVKSNVVYPAVKKAIEYLNNNLTDKIYISDLASYVFMSESRIQHLFKEQMNIPINNYLQLLRIKKIIALSIQGEPLNECVLSCGFTDSSHLNRVFKNMFGIAPSIFLKNSRIIQVGC